MIIKFRHKYYKRNNYADYEMIKVRAYIIGGNEIY
jgi:hypothetical protein